MYASKDIWKENLNGYTYLNHYLWDKQVHCVLQHLNLGFHEPHLHETIAIPAKKKLNFNLTIINNEKNFMPQPTTPTNNHIFQEVCKSPSATQRAK